MLLARATNGSAAAARTQGCSEYASRECMVVVVVVRFERVVYVGGGFRYAGGVGTINAADEGTTTTTVSRGYYC